MATERVTTNITPNAFQLSFALIVLKSKPEEISVKDYVLSLRRQLKLGPLYSQHLPQWVLAEVAFWKSEYERVDIEKAAMHAQIVQLERRQDAESVADSVSGADAASRPPTKAAATGKRKKLPAVAPRSKRLKSTAQSSSTAHGAANLHDSMENDFEITGAQSKEGQALVQGTHSIHYLLKSLKGDQAQLLSHFLGHTAISIGSLFAYHSQQLARLSLAENDATNSASKVPAAVKASRNAQCDYTATVRAAARAFSTITLGLSKLAESSDDKNLQAHVVYSCARMIKRCLEAMSQACETFAFSSPLEKPSKQSTSKSSKPAHAPELGRAICQFLCAAIMSLHTQESHQLELLEGFLYVLFERVGNRLYLSTFDHERTASIKEDIISSATEHTASSAAVKSAELASLTYESPLLVSLLEKAVSTAPQFYSLSQANEGKGKAKISRTQTTAKKGAVVGKAAFSRDAKEKMQQTLVNGIFGQDDTTARACLVMPVGKVELPTPPNETQQDRMHWFREEVWRLVGWDVLASENDF